MIKKYKFYKKIILIIGLGQTGKSVAKFLLKKKCKIFFWDDNEQVKGEKNIERVISKKLNPKYFDYIFISPGIRKKNPLVKKFLTKGVKLSNDIELFLYDKKFFNIKNPLIAITGTNGKSTVALMIAEAIKTKPLGNYGNMVLENTAKSKKAMVLELSSFQLDYIKKIKPKISIITNIKPDHIEHHGNFNIYRETKFKITNHQNASDFLILNYDDNELRKKFKIQIDGGPKIIWVSRKKCLKKGIFIKNRSLVDNYFDKKIYEFEENIFLRLEHNKLNLGLTYACLKVINAKANNIIKKFSNFKGLPHRIEFVGKLNNIDFYNDSKATNVAATCSALESFEKVILIAGGTKKGENFKPLNKYLDKIYAVFLFGESANEIKQVLKKVSKISICEDMLHAVKESYASNIKSNNSYPILLSPASASFDFYENYKQRGEHFKIIFKEMLENVA